MRVLIVSKALVSAAYRKKLAALSRAGVEVTAVVPRVWREGGRNYPLEFGEDMDYRLIAVDLHWNGHFHLHHYPELGRIIREAEPDLVHLDEEPYNLATYLGVRACWRRHVPCVFFSWQNLVRVYPPPFRQIERSVYRNVQGAIAGTKAVAEVLRSKGYGGRMAVIPQFGVDLDAFFPGEIVERPFRIGFLNRLIPAKAPLQTLDAFAGLPDDCFLEFVGDGPLRGEIEAAIVRLGLGDRVRVRTRVPSEEVPALLSSLHALVLPSLTTPSWKEQFGRVLIEAMASGVPVVGSDSGEIPRVVGDAGIITPEGDVAAFAVALRRLHDDGELRRSLAARGRNRAVAQFGNQTIAERSLKFYREVLAPEE